MDLWLSDNILPITQATSTLLAGAPDIVGLLADRLGWDRGELWQEGNDGNLHRTVAWQRANGPTVPASEQTFAHGIGIPGHAWSSGRPVWITDLHRETRFFLRQGDVYQDVVTACAFPVLDGRRRLLGVMVFLSCTRRAPDVTALQTLSLVAHMLGEWYGAPSPLSVEHGAR